MSDLDLRYEKLIMKYTQIPLNIMVFQNIHVVIGSLQTRLTTDILIIFHIFWKIKNRGDFQK